MSMTESDGLLGWSRPWMWQIADLSPGYEDQWNNPYNATLIITGWSANFYAPEGVAGAVQLYVDSNTVDQFSFDTPVVFGSDVRTGLRIPAGPDALIQVNAITFAGPIQVNVWGFYQPNRAFVITPPP